MFKVNLMFFIEIFQDYFIKEVLISFFFFQFSLKTFIFLIHLIMLLNYLNNLYLILQFQFFLLINQKLILSNDFHILVNH